MRIFVFLTLTLLFGCQHKPVETEVISEVVDDGPTYQIGYITPIEANQEVVLAKVKALEAEGDLSSVEVFDAEPKLIIVHGDPMLLEILQDLALKDYKKGDVVTNRLLVAGPISHEDKIEVEVNAMVEQGKLKVFGHYDHIFPILTGPKCLLDQLLIDSSVDIDVRCKIDPIFAKHVDDYIDSIKKS